jgi:uncharacterized repeat protein (TIGR02543 family)
MKKILLTVAVTLFTALSFSSVAYAATDEQMYKQQLEATKNERTDVYALDFYKTGAYSKDPVIVKQANEIVAGITNEYDKAQAIFQWVYENVTYTTSYPADLEGIEQWKYGTCVRFAATTQNLLQAAGLPAKTVLGGAYSGGTWDGHEWNEVYVDNRWVFVDSTFGEFDLPIEVWSRTHDVSASIITQDEEAWNGSLYFCDYNTYKVLKEVKNFPLNSLVTSTYGFDIKYMYFIDDTPFKLNTLKVNSQNAIIYVKPAPVVKKYKVTFNSNSGTTIKSVTVTAKSLIIKPTNPTRKGYTFIGWYKDSKCTKVWNFKTDKVTANTTLYAKWLKK